MKKLKISNTLSLPVDTFVTSTQAILAQKGKGKSYTASVQAEELLDAGQQVVVVDPTGAWWGLRSSADGQSKGYPIAILGGEHADVPLEATAGEVIADAIASEHFSAVIDLTLFRKNEALRFMALFLETLYRRNREALHLFIDEADVVAPQKTFSPEQARCLGASEDIVRRGRIRGIGCTLISQRAQVINKDVLSQVDMLTTLGMNHPKDLKAIDDWVAVHGDPKQAEKMIESLPSLPKGDAWVWAPASDLFTRVTIRKRRTFDSGRTPKSGERVSRPKALAEIDIAKLGETIASTVERAKEDDPKLLKVRVAELEKQLAAKKTPAPKVETKTVEKLLVKPAELARGERLVARMEKSAETMRAIADEVLQESKFLRNALNFVSKQPAPAVAPRTGVHRADERRHVDRVAKPTSSARGPMPDGSFTGAQHELLATLAWWRAVGHDEPTKAQVAGKAGWKVKGSHLRNRLAELKGHGVIDYPSAGRIALTDAGAKVAPFPNTSDTLLESLRSSLTGAQREVFDVLVDGRARSREDLAAELGWEPKGSHLRNRLAELSARELVEYPTRGEVAIQPWVIA